MSRKDPENAGKQKTAAQVRDQRLAEALRANLKRRKAAHGPAMPNSNGKHEDSGE